MSINDYEGRTGVFRYDDVNGILTLRFDDERPRIQMLAIVPYIELEVEKVHCDGLGNHDSSKFPRLKKVSLVIDESGQVGAIFKN